MEGLYNKVIKGSYPKINERFSKDLSSVIGALLQLHAENRPNCDQILKHPMIIKRIEYFKTLNMDVDGPTHNDPMLLETIRIPKNLLYLSDKLPNSNYGEGNKMLNIQINKSARNFELPDINLNKISKSIKKDNNSELKERSLILENSNSPKKGDESIINDQNKNRLIDKGKQSQAKQNKKNKIYVNNSINNDLLLLPNINHIDQSNRLNLVKKK